MQKFLVIIGLILLALGLRSSCSRIVRKLGAVLCLFVSFLIAAFLFHSWAAGVLGLLPWILLPWIELSTRIRSMRFPLENRLSHKEHPNVSYFPNAREAVVDLEDLNFEHVGNCNWEWSGMQQYFQLYWHPEKRAEVTICLCEQEQVIFSFLSITSRDLSGRVLRTTNFPFSPTLKCPGHIIWNHVPCKCCSFRKLLDHHLDFLNHQKLGKENLCIPDPDKFEESIEAEMRHQLEHNIKSGIILPALGQEGCFRYSFRGLLYLWYQYVKDMIRLC